MAPLNSLTQAPRLPDFVSEVIRQGQEQEGAMSNVQTVHRAGAVPSGLALVARPEDALGVHPKESESPPNRDERMNEQIARFQDDLPDWRYGGIDLRQVVVKVRNWASDLWEHFLAAGWNGVTLPRSPFLVRFEWEHPNVLGHYQPGRNDLGLRWELSVNPRHLRRRTEIQVAAVVLHEILHSYECGVGKAPKSRNGYHSSDFQKLADQLGIPCTSHGAERGIRVASPFMAWARARGLKGEPMMVVAEVSGTVARRPKRVPWMCACPRDTAVTAMIARGSELRVHCDRCGAPYRRCE